MQVFRKLSNVFAGDSALSTWLTSLRIAVNTVLMRFRKKALRQVSLDEPARTIRMPVLSAASMEAKR